VSCVHPRPMLLSGNGPIRPDVSHRACLLSSAAQCTKLLAYHTGPPGTPQHATALVATPRAPAATAVGDRDAGTRTRHHEWPPRRESWVSETSRECLTVLTPEPHALLTSTRRERDARRANKTPAQEPAPPTPSAPAHARLLDAPSP
jgi:hypothetical protein